MNTYFDWSPRSISIALWIATNIQTKMNNENELFGDQACSFSPYCLGMCEWTGCPGASAAATSSTFTNMELHPQTEAFQPLPVPRPVPSNSVTASCLMLTATPPKRFCFATEDQLGELAKGYIPPNTNRQTKWALKVPIGRDTLNSL